MNCNKRRGDKHHGRGCRKNGSGRRGGTGRAGHNKHKLSLGPVKAYKKRTAYIHATELVRKLDTFLATGAIILKDGVYHVWTKRLPKILERSQLSIPHELHG